MELAKTGGRIGRALQRHKSLAVAGSATAVTGLWATYSESLNVAALLESLLGPKWFEFVTSPLIVHLLGLAGIAVSIFCLWRIGTLAEKAEIDSPLIRATQAITLQSNYCVEQERLLLIASKARQIRGLSAKVSASLDLMRSRGTMVEYFVDAYASIEHMRSEIMEVGLIIESSNFGVPFPALNWKMRADGTRSYALADNQEYLTALEGLVVQALGLAERLERDAEQGRVELQSIRYQVRQAVEGLNAQK